MIPKEQRIAIAKEIVDGSLSSREAAEKYGISKSLAAKYATDYRRENGLPVRTSTPRTPETKAIMLKSSNDSFHLEDYQSMTKDQLPINECKSKWLLQVEKRLEHPSKRLLSFVSDLALFKEYHAKYPSHGYRWLNAKIRLDTGLKMSDQYAHKCCKTAGIMSISKHYRYKKPGDPFKVYPNLMATGLNITGPLQCITSDMTAFRLKGVYYELTLYMDLWNNEILSYSLSGRKGDRTTYISGLKDLISIKQKYPGLEMILHTDQGSVYASKDFNELLPLYNIVHSMSRAGTPTDNAAMEAINGWIKTEMFTDLHITSNENIENEIKEYITFFNEERPAYSLNYLTPKQYKEYYAQF